MDPLTELQSRPSYESAVAAYSTMQVEMRDAITAAAPEVQWTIDEVGIASGCEQPFSNLGGRSTGLDTWTASGGIPDGLWPAARDAASAAAARYGLTETTTIVEMAGRHQVRFSNPRDGTYTELLTDVNAVLGSSTGCFLPEAARSATPAPPPASR